MNQQHSGNKSYIASKSEHHTDFGIRHFAGVVHYDSKGTTAKCKKKKSNRMSNVRRLAMFLSLFRVPGKEQRCRQF